MYAIITDCLFVFLVLTIMPRPSTSKHFIVPRLRMKQDNEATIAIATDNSKGWLEYLDLAYGTLLVQG